MLKRNSEYKKGNGGQDVVTVTMLLQLLTKDFQRNRINGDLACRATQPMSLLRSNDTRGGTLLPQGDIWPCRYSQRHPYLTSQETCAKLSSPSL